MLIAQRPVLTEEAVSEHRSRFVIEPLEPGFGYTLGNSLRRTLLSSIPGAAVTSLKIDGNLHEFSTIEGVVEDVTEVILNLKGLVVSSEEDEPVTMYLRKQGPGAVTAGDIVPPAGVTVHNPDMHIATLNDKGKLEVELVVERGRGYVPAVQNKASGAEIGRIPVDSIYSPVLKVTYKVEATRVEQRTDFDKLILDVETKSSITARDALASAGKTLVDVLPSGAITNPRADDAASFERAAPSERTDRAPSLRPIARSSRAPSEIPRAPRSPALIWGGILLALSLAIVIATIQLRPELLGRLSHTDPEPVVKPPVVVVKRPAAGDLVVRVATERAQVLRFVGRGPVSVPHLPLGVAHEFVAVSDTASPARLLVPKDAEWEGTPDGPRYEAAMQLGATGALGTSELGETLLPQDVGTPSEKLGTVRIVTTPRGAKVYQLIGFAPEARVQALPLESTQELLIYRKGHASELRVVAPSDYLERGDKKVAELEVTLNALPKTTVKR